MTSGDTILVTGVTGCIGRAVVDAARRRGFRVRGLARRAPVGGWPADVDVVQGDVRDRAAVERAIEGCASVVHLAGWVHRVPRGPADLVELRSSIVDGTANVARSAAELQAHLVMTSSIAVFGGGRDGRGLEPSTPYGQAKLAAEARARALHPGVVILRPSVVYGPHDRGNMAALVAAVERRFGFIIGDGTNRKSMVYAANLADRIVAALGRDDLAGVWVASDDPAPTQRELLEEIARALGRRRPTAVPRWPLAGAAALVDLVAQTRFRERIRKLAEDTEFPGTALDQALGYAPRVPWPVGLRATIGQV